MNVKCFHTFDFASAKKRACRDNNPIDEYQVQVEDYENINDLISRSVRIKKPFIPEKNPSAIYESDEDIAKQLLEKELFVQKGIELDQEVSEVEQSEDKQSSASNESTTSEQTL